MVEVEEEAQVGAGMAAWGEVALAVEGLGEVGMVEGETEGEGSAVADLVVVAKAMVAAEMVEAAMVGAAMVRVEVG